MKNETVGTNLLYSRCRVGHGNGSVQFEFSHTHL